MKFEKSEILRRFNELSFRERFLALFGAVFLCVYAGYQFLYQPIVAENLLLEQKIDSQRQLYHFLQQVAAEVTVLRVQGAGAAMETEKQSMMVAIDSSSQQLDIKPAIKKLQPEADQQARLVLENVAFDKLIVWLAVLETKHLLQVVDIEIDRPPAGGMGQVHVKLLLGEAA